MTETLASNIQATVGECFTVMLEERGRGFASMQESWAEIKRMLEYANDTKKDIDNLHKEMWEAVKGFNDDGYAALVNELHRQATAASAKWAMIAAAASMEIG